MADRDGAACGGHDCGSSEGVPSDVVGEGTDGGIEVWAVKESWRLAYVHACKGELEPHLVSHTLIRHTIPPSALVVLTVPLHQDPVR